MTEAKSRKKLLIISHDKIGSSMAGPGIRYHHMAEVLSATFDVTVGFFDPGYLPEEAFPRSYQPKHIDAHDFESGFMGADIVIAHWLSDHMIAYCNQNGVFTVFDLYVPGPVENLTQKLFSGDKVQPEDDFAYNRSLAMYQKFFESGDLFLFSNPRQLDYWTGYFFGCGLVSLSTYPKRPIYDRFIYAPMGIDSKAPLKHSQDVIKGVIPGISKSDKLLLWTGGIWNHFDGQILIKAMDRVKDKRPDIKLLFIGTKHPNPSIPEMKESVDTKKLATEIGLIGKTVYFNDSWVKYTKRYNYLLEADAAVNTHKLSIETEFSHRTRVLDHFLAGLPTISTAGDYLSDSVVVPKGLGIVVPPDDVGALEKAIVEILEPQNNAAIRKRIAAERQIFAWENTMHELKKTLSSGIGKLPLLNTATNVQARSKTRKAVAKALPLPLKKAIIRTFRMR